MRVRALKNKPDPQPGDLVFLAFVVSVFIYVVALI